MSDKVCMLSVSHPPTPQTPTLGIVQTDLSECTQRLSLLQQQQKELTEALSERGDPGQALLKAVL